jgi:hypothetical protein
VSRSVSSPIAGCRSRYQPYVVGVSQADEYYDDKARIWFEVVVLRDWGNRLSFPRLTYIGVVHMPLYTAFIQEGTVSIVTKARIGEEVTQIHTTVMRVHPAMP